MSAGRRKSAGTGRARKARSAGKRPAAKRTRARAAPAKRPDATRPAAKRALAAQRHAAERPAAVASAALQHQGERVSLGQTVSGFALPATGGAHWRLQDARGRKLVIYFYPRDNTPGCTLEGQQFAALAPRFDQAGITLVGISRDSLAAHESFRDKMKFPFQLLSDASGAVCMQFDVWREKNLYGRKSMGIERSTFLLDANGVLQREWRKVRVDGHALAVLEAAQAL